MSQQTYSTRRAAIVGARRALEREGIKDALSQVHFTVIEDGEAWAWEPIDQTPAQKPAATRRPEVVALMAKGLTASEAKATVTEGVQTTHHPAKAITFTPDAKPGESNVGAKARQQAAAAAAVAAAPPVSAPPPAPRTSERWRRPKRVEPAKCAYRPRAGSSQATLYALLNTPSGVTVEGLCHEMRKTVRKPDSVEWLYPERTWANVNYLLCSLKGYGLVFDGKLMRLLVPRDERDAPKKGG